MKREKYNHIHRMLREYDYTYIIIIVIFAIIKQVANKTSFFTSATTSSELFYILLAKGR